ncbi:threonine synthase [Halobacillus halophilus]|uniref:Threonine synthase n=1 Tax=Halobacillus halophilus (strain ATCC 35676 / DSM 2266 / JCM 20832 / KCTC 3685 / LMG 17431 / NBRC 102448 / NCIMB 2269) TaxID=866895 RepID=I0JSY3_HALH3|nr:threonine synthase [Halobacillus halophilus]ASF41176.1 threonine synthase [Halobacillus halophilus]CCG47255.1 threonine synthase [Halobacillus halophilus DSM 2266]
MNYSYISHLYCPKCSKTYSSKETQHLCTCGSPLLVEYRLDELAHDWKKDHLANRSPDLWRYHELLPLEDEQYKTTLGEGMSPLLSMNKIGQDMGIHDLLMKDEGTIPTGSFKARGAAVGVSKAKELGVEEMAMPTNGNAGAAWSLYAARASMKSTIVMPIDAPKITRNECAISGASLYLVDGLISDAGQIVGNAVKEKGMYNVSTLKEPYRIEGKKTMGLEIAEQLNWEVPDVILYPTGGGVGLIGIHKALKELQQLGWISDDKMPRLVAVQSEGCAPIVKAWEKGETEAPFWENSETVAFGINVPKALGDFLVLEALYETDGCAIAISDDALLEEQKKVAQKEGAFVCPEGAAAFSAARRLRDQGWIHEEEKVVVLNTGAGIKYPDTVNVDLPILNPGDRIR